MYVAVVSLPRSFPRLAPRTDANGMTKASTPPSLSLLCPRSMKLDARQAFPLLNMPAAFLSFRPMACCSSCEVLKPANDGTGISAWPASWFVGRVNGGFMMTKSQDLSSIVTGCTLWLSDSVPPMDWPVANKEYEFSESRRSSAPMCVLPPSIP